MKRSISGFDWDSGNWRKCGKHGLTKPEIERVFMRTPSVYPDQRMVKIESVRSEPLRKAGTSSSSSPCAKASSEF